MNDTVLIGNALSLLKNVPGDFAQCCVTSPPYWGLRDYGVVGQLGREKAPEEYVANIVAVFREVRRVLTSTGTLWLNLGDSYTSGGRSSRATDRKNPVREDSYRAPTPGGLKPKDLIGIPWMVAFALRADGWYLRSDIIWHKPNVMPESVTDRPTKAHEYRPARNHAKATPIASAPEVHAFTTVSDGPCNLRAEATAPARLPCK